MLRTSLKSLTKLTLSYVVSLTGYSEFLDKEILEYVKELPCNSETLTEGLYEMSLTSAKYKKMMLWEVVY